MSIAGGEPLLHKEMPQIVEGIIARRKFVYLCTNALLMKKISTSTSRARSSSGRCISTAIRRCTTGRCARTASTSARSRPSGGQGEGFRVNINCTLFNDAVPEHVAAFFDTLKPMGVDGITVSPGYAYERAPDQEHFLNRAKTKQLFRDIFRRGNNGRDWSFSQSSLFLDFLAGNQDYHCTPWGNPTRTVFGWQRPCYLLGEGYAKTFRELMEETDWDAYGTGNYEKCADCMVHSGFEATAVNDAVAHPLKAAITAVRGVRTEGPMVPEIPLHAQRRRNTCSSARSKSRWCECTPPSRRSKPRGGELGGVPFDLSSSSPGLSRRSRLGRLGASPKRDARVKPAHDELIGFASIKTRVRTGSATHAVAFEESGHIGVAHASRSSISAKSSARSQHDLRHQRCPIAPCPDRAARELSGEREVQVLLLARRSPLVLQPQPTLAFGAGFQLAIKRVW